DEQYTTTDVTLGYASKEPTDDDFSHLGGSPVRMNSPLQAVRTWLDDEPLSASLARCKTCNTMMALLLQLNGDLPEYFPGHERKLYIFACRNKPCRKKPGTIRALRATKIPTSTPKKSSQPSSSDPTEAPKATTPPTNLGDSIFKSTSPNQASTTANPFSTSSHASLNPNPFSTTSAANPIPYGHQKHHFKSLPPQPNPQAPPTSASSLSQSFAQKAQISSPQHPPPTPSPRTPWPSPTSLPHPYPSYHLDADYETLSAPTPAPTTSSSLPITNTDPTSTEANNEDDEPSSWLSPSSIVDKTFLRFAARLAENPEQVLRYEFRGEPLLYNKIDEVGRAFPSAVAATKGSVGASLPNRVPACGNCGGKRVFEMQLTPHAISELEKEEEGVEGMEWGTVVVGVCDGDCVEKGVEEGKVRWVEEWVGVSWEESVGGRKG
ncbi:MAG: hypothetical protein Q9184_005599, partial [Pyrenodesmia sp. 2 TL-2023]